MQLGDTFIAGQGGHLWIVISSPSNRCGHYVIVNLTTNPSRAGTDCILDVGDHYWISEKSYVSYGDAKIVSPAQEALLMTCMENGSISRNRPMDADILRDIIDCGKKSKALAPCYKAYL
jgi:hypothetical protein